MKVTQAIKDKLSAAGQELENNCYPYYGGFIINLSKEPTLSSSDITQLRFILELAKEIEVLRKVAENLSSILES